MVTVKYVLAITKCRNQYIDNVMFGNYKDNTCTCLITFKSLSDEMNTWSCLLIDLVNKCLVACDAIISQCSTSKNIVIKFKVKLS